MERIDTRIIALDLDDTLLKDDLSISDYTVQVLRTAAERGIYIVLASGRTDNAVLPYVRRLELAGTQQGRFMICQNGATIMDLHTRLPIYTRVLDPETAIHAYRTASGLGLACEIYDASTIYASVKNDYTEVDVKLSGLKQQIVEDYEPLLRKGFPKMVIPGDPDVLQDVQRTLKEEIGKKAVIFISKPYFLEIMPAESGKGEALAFLTEYLHIPHEKTMAFGDSMNDESMIRYAGDSVAMKNGLPYIQSLAKHITEKTNDEDGIAHFIEDHVLN